jgi:hypothetical protein
MLTCSFLNIITINLRWKLFTFLQLTFSFKQTGTHFIVIFNYRVLMKTVWTQFFPLHNRNYFMLSWTNYSPTTEHWILRRIYLPIIAVKKINQNERDEKFTCCVCTTKNGGFINRLIYFVSWGYRNDLMR